MHTSTRACPNSYRSWCLFSDVRDSVLMSIACIRKVNKKRVCLALPFEAPFPAIPLWALSKVVLALIPYTF